MAAGINIFIVVVALSAVAVLRQPILRDVLGLGRLLLLSVLLEVVRRDHIRVDLVLVLQIAVSPVDAQKIAFLKAAIRIAVAGMLALRGIENADLR